MVVGVLGGSGIYDIDGLANIEEKRIETPFGNPSDAYICGTFQGVDVCFLPRHARGHTILPSELNHRANIYGFKTLGANHVVSLSAVGSLKAALRPEDVCLPDQYYDRTKKSLEHTFFGSGVVAHVSLAEPGCPALRELIHEHAVQVVEDGDLDVRVQPGGTYVNMEGPAFSTKAESNVYRSMGFDVIGMTSLGEAKLCREAEICYQAIALVTDYDCWHEEESAVTVDMVYAHLVANTKLAKEILKVLIPAIPEKRTCGCGSALENALMTAKDKMPEETVENLRPIIGKYL